MGTHLRAAVEPKVREVHRHCPSAQTCHGSPGVSWVDGTPQDREHCMHQVNDEATKNIGFYLILQIQNPLS